MTIETLKSIAIIILLMLVRVHHVAISNILTDLTTASETIEQLETDLRLLELEQALFEYELSTPEPLVAESDNVTLDVALSEVLQDYVHYVCEIYDLDFYLVMAVIQVESGYDETAVSNNNYGLMQINSINHDWLTEELQLENGILLPFNNILAGCHMLSLFTKHDTWNEMLMCYNLGETGAKNLWVDGVYSSNYTDKVYSAYCELKGVEWVE